jgi:hypothetical protein
VFTNVADTGLAGHAALTRVRGWLAPVERFFLLTPSEGAATSLHCATAPGVPGGQYFTACAPGRVSGEAHDAAVGARIWATSVAWAQHT